MATDPYLSPPYMQASKCSASFIKVSIRGSPSFRMIKMPPGSGSSYIFRGGLFIFGRLPRVPNFAEIYARVGRGLQPPDFRDLIPPWGHTLLHGEAGKLTKEVGFASPRDVPWRGGGLGGRGFGGRKAAHGGGKTGAIGAKSRTRGRFRGARGVRGRRDPGQNRAKPGLFRGRAGQKPGGAGAKRGVRAPFGGGYGGRWGEKAPFCREKGGQRGCGGAKTGGESWRGV